MPPFDGITVYIVVLGIRIPASFGINYGEMKMADKYHKDHEAEELDLQAFYLFIRTARAVLKYSDTYLYNKAHLSLIKFVVLHVLAANKATMSLKDLSMFTNTGNNNITMLIDRMKKEGLVTTRRRQSDKRVVNVKLTDSGTEVATKAFELVQEILDRVMSPSDEVDLIAFMKRLNIMNQNTAGALKEMSAL